MKITKNQTFKNIKRETINKVETKVDYFPISHKELEDDDFIKISFDDISSFGSIFSSIAPELKKVLGGNKGETLYKMIIPKGLRTGESLTISKSGGIIGNVVNNSGKISQRAEFIPENVKVEKLSLNVPMVFLAIAVASINNKLDDIKETQKEILEFLKQKEVSKLKADVDTLYQILESYKHNWNNRIFKTNNYSLALVVRKGSVDSIKLYRDQIKKKLGKKTKFGSDRKVKKRIKEMLDDFNNYEMALFIYAFASFMEVLFIENYKEDYLKSVIKTIKAYEDKYLDLHKKCYAEIESESRKTIQAYSLKGVAGFNKAIGKTIAKIPKIRDGLVDEKLIERGEKVDKYSLRRTENTMESFKKDSCKRLKPFIDNIELINAIYNKPVDVLFDNENLYLSIDD